MGDREQRQAEFREELIGDLTSRGAARARAEELVDATIALLLARREELSPAAAAALLPPPDLEWGDQATFHVGRWSCLDVGCWTLPGRAGGEDLEMATDREGGPDGWAIAGVPVTAADLEAAARIIRREERDRALGELALDAQDVGGYDEERNLDAVADSRGDTIGISDGEGLRLAGLGHLADDAPSRTCSACGRTTVAADEFGRPCGFPQPSGAVCVGRFST